MKKILLSLCLLLAPCAVKADPGFYIQAAGGGASSFELFQDDENGYAGKLSAGYLWGDNPTTYGLESGLFYAPSLMESSTNSSTNGNTTTTQKYSTTYRTTALDVLGVLKHTFDDRVGLFAKGGAAYVQQTRQHTEDNIYQTSNSTRVIHSKSSVTSNSSLAPILAVGFSYQFDSHVETDLTASTIFHQGSINAISALMFGINYRFA